MMAGLAASALFALCPLVQAEDQPAKPAGRPPAAQRSDMAKQRLAKMAEELQLTEAQKPKVEALMKEQAEKRRSLRDATPEERKEKMKAEVAETDKKMKEILNAEQYAKWEKLRKGARPARRGAPGAGKPDKN